AFDRQWPSFHLTAILRRADDGAYGKFAKRQSPIPIGRLGGDVRCEDLVGAGLEIVFRRSLLQRDLAQPLDAARADVSGDDDAQRKTVCWRQRFAVHLEGEDDLWAERFFERNRTTETELEI